MFLAFLNVSVCICYYETFKSFFGKFESFSHVVQLMKRGFRNSL